MATKRPPSKKRDPLAAACALARAGKTDEAIAALSPLADEGSVPAAYALLELRAFRGKWDDVLALARRVVADPDALRTSNTVDDTVRLIGAAGRASRRWAEVEAVAEVGLQAARRDGDQVRETVFGNLVKYARREGAAPHELVMLFGDNDQPPRTRAQYDVAVEKSRQNKRKPDDLARHQFALAVVYQQPDEIVRLFDANEKLMSFANAVDAARVLVDRHQPDRAFTILAERLGQWFPVEQVQVAPVVLLVDERLGTLMNPKRCAAVLSTPRGPEATQ